jgi:ParB family chromosome partitioning protein
MPATDVDDAQKISDEDSVGHLENVPVASIIANLRNPRKTFDPRTIERLAASLEEIHLQVPVTVYRDQTPGTSNFILLDGERRFRAAKMINWDTIPALVVKAPSANENAVRMFNIHMLREEWREIETAWALEQIMEETGITLDRDLQRMTGLSPDRIKNMKRVLAFPKSYQQKVADGELSYQFLVELDKNVLSRQRQSRQLGETDPIISLSVPELRDVFLRKYSDGVESDIVELRRVATLFDTAKNQGKVAERARAALRTLVTEPAATIEEAYELGAAASVELKRVIRDLVALPGRVVDLLESGIDTDQRLEVVAAVRAACERLSRVAGA